MPTYLHGCENCKHEWEEEYKINDPIPTKCPKCKKKKVKRLIYASAGKVELTGKELIKHLESEGKKMAKDFGKNEKALASFLGESKYESLLKERGR